MVFGLLLVCAVVFIDWRSLIQRKKLKINFKVWN